MPGFTRIATHVDEARDDEQHQASMQSNCEQNTPKIETQAADSADRSLQDAFLTTTQTCVNCNCAISDSLYLRTSPECAWHVGCLSCSVCNVRLDAQTSCFVRNGSVFCGVDYRRFFSRKCSKCDLVIDPNEYVMLIKDLVFHTSCFACVCCKRSLSKGEQFALVGGSNLYCQTDYESLLQQAAVATPLPISAASSASAANTNNADASANDSNNNHDARQVDKPNSTKRSFNSSCNSNSNSNNCQKGRPRKRKELSLDSASRSEVSVPQQPPIVGLNLPSSLSNGCYPPTLFSQFGADHGNSHPCLSMNMITQSPSASENSQKQQQLAMSGSVRQKRMRTSFKHHQLRAMKAYFNLNHNPDARDLKQLSEKTGLSKRVLQVWFQNSRAKYRRSVLKHQQDNGSQWKDGRKMSPLHDEQSDELGSAASRDNAGNIVPINPMDAVDQILAQEKVLSLKDADVTADDDDDDASCKDGSSVFSHNYDSICSSPPAQAHLHVSLTGTQHPHPHPHPLQQQLQLQPNVNMNMSMTSLFTCDMQSRAFING